VRKVRTTRLPSRRKSIVAAVPQTRFDRHKLIHYTLTLLLLSSTSGALE
jgi:hypothetical protein